MRIWVEQATGQPVKGGRHLDGSGHEYIDCTDRPMPTVMAGRPVYFIIDRSDEHRRLPLSS